MTVQSFSPGIIAAFGRGRTADQVPMPAQAGEERFPSRHFLSITEKLRLLSSATQLSPAALEPILEGDASVEETYAKLTALIQPSNIAD